MNNPQSNSNTYQRYKYFERNLYLLDKRSIYYDETAAYYRKCIEALRHIT